MTIYEYGDRSKPHILLVHGMWMMHEMMLPYVDKLRDDYHIIAPDLTGHGSDKGRFESSQKDTTEIVDWLVQNQMTELALVFGASLGGVIAMDVISNENVLHTLCCYGRSLSYARTRCRVGIPCYVPCYENAPGDDRQYVCIHAQSGYGYAAEASGYNGTYG